MSGLIASERKLKERPHEIGRAIKAGTKANRYIRQNRDGTLPIRPQGLKIDKEMTARTYDSSVKTFSEKLAVPEDGLGLLSDDAKRTAKVNREISLSDVADLSVLKSAQRQMGSR